MDDEKDREIEILRRKVQLLMKIIENIYDNAMKSNVLMKEINELPVK